MVELQTPRFVYMRGELRPWDQAVLHVGTEAVNRGLSVFEGTKGYWQAGGEFAFVNLRAHWERLRRSARLLHIPYEQSFDDYVAAIRCLVTEELTPQRDMWARTTLFVTEGHWGEGTAADLVVTAYQQDRTIPGPISLGVSTWRRSSDESLPPRIKSPANYQVGRLARIEARGRGWDDMVLLNQWGRVAEATGSCVMIVRNGVVATPPASEGALESITVDIVEELAASLSIPFVRRPIERTELLIADEIAICGTLAEITVVHAMDGLSVAGGEGLLAYVQRGYFDAVRGVKPQRGVELTPL